MTTMNEKQWQRLREEANDEDVEDPRVAAYLRHAASQIRVIEENKPAPPYHHRFFKPVTVLGTVGAVAVFGPAALAYIAGGAATAYVADKLYKNCCKR